MSMVVAVVLLTVNAVGWSGALIRNALEVLENPFDTTIPRSLVSILPLGTTHVMFVVLLILNSAATPPMVTVRGLAKLVPVIVIGVPDIPVEGLTEYMAGFSGVVDTVV